MTCECLFLLPDYSLFCTTSRAIVSRFFFSHRVPEVIRSLVLSYFIICCLRTYVIVMPIVMIIHQKLWKKSKLPDFVIRSQSKLNLHTQPISWPAYITHSTHWHNFETFVHKFGEIQSRILSWKPLWKF